MTVWLKLIDQLIRLALTWTRAGSEGIPRAFCLPGDHIGDDIFIHGFYERDLLEGLFSAV